MSTRLRLLIVEDSESDAALVVRLLRKAGYDVHSQRVETAAAMRAALAAQPWDVVVSDHQMPELDAPRALAVLRESDADLPFIVSSGTLGESVAVSMMKAGAHDYVMKGDLTRLAPAVERELREAEARRQGRRAIEALKLQEERLRLAIEGASLATWHWDLTSGVVTWSERAYAMFGLPPGAATTHDQFLALLHPQDVETVEAGISAALAGGRYDVEYRLRWPDGSWHWIASSGRAYHDAQGAPSRMEGVAREVTEQKRLEEELRQSQRMEAIGRLAGGVAHDFNNILSVIQGHCDLMSSALRPDDPLVRSVEQIQASSQRAAGLTRQLLAFSRKQALRPQVLDLNATVRGLVSMLRRLIGEDVELSTSLADDLARVLADAGQIEQVLINLAVNARDAMPTGGQLAIRTANLHLDREQVSLHGTVAPGVYVTLSVSDSGCGMERATLSRIFEPFFTTKEAGKGTGLGLSTVYGIIAQSGGSITCESEIGRGTCFTVFLPRTEAALTPGEALAPRPVSRGRGERVLVVEDETAMREIVRDALTDFGYRATVAANGGEAILAVESGELRPDALLTDVIMPGMSGTALAERLRRAVPALKVLFMSGYMDGDLAGYGELVAGAPFIQKPFRMTELAAALSSLLGSSSAPATGCPDERGA